MVFQVELLDNIYLEHVSMPKTLYEGICNIHPIIKEKETHRRYLAAVMGNKLPYSKSGKPMVPHQLLAYFMGVEVDQIENRNYSVIDFLEELQRETFYDLKITDYNPSNRKCRELEDTGLITLLEEIVSNNSCLAEEVRVFIMSGLEVKHREQASNCEKERDSHKEDVFKYEHQKAIAEYMNELPLSMFSSIVDTKYSSVYKLAHSEEDRNTKSYLLSAINGIASIPIPFYSPSKKELSLCPRLFGTGLASLKKEYRRMFTSEEWIDFDLTNCQLAIAAGIWHIESIQDYLKTGKSIWPELMKYLEIPPDKRTSEVKRVVKKALYSTIYGKRIKDWYDKKKGEFVIGVDTQLKEDLKELDVITDVNLSTHPLMCDLIDTLSKVKRDINRKHGCKDAYGFMVRPNSLDTDSFISYVIQTYELRLIYSVFEVAIDEKNNRHKTFDVSLMQHDGVSIKLVKEQYRDKIISKIQEAVKRTANELGIQTTLEEDKG